MAAYSRYESAAVLASEKVTTRRSQVGECGRRSRVGEDNAVEVARSRTTLVVVDGFKEIWVKLGLIMIPVDGFEEVGGRSRG